MLHRSNPCLFSSLGVLLPIGSVVWAKNRGDAHPLSCQEDPGAGMALPVASPRLEVGGKGMVARVTCVAKGCLLDFVLSGGGQPSHGLEGCACRRRRQGS